MGRSSSDAELAAKLAAVGISMDRQQLVAAFSDFISAEDMSKDVIARHHASGDGEFSLDWVWISLTVFWERWCPEVPNMEMVDDTMQLGYRALEKSDSVSACRHWLDAWRAVLKIMERANIQTLKQLDEQFLATQSLFNWLQDFEMELSNATLDEPAMIQDRISFCQEVLDRIGHNWLAREDFQTALAEAHFTADATETGDRVFREAIEQNPQASWTWIKWADCYAFFAQPEHKDLARAQQILEEGLAVKDLEDRDALVERLTELYRQTGQHEKAQQLARVQPAPRVASSFRQDIPSPADHGSGDPHVRVGRNDPCPCGSGKKFKKCCIRTTA
jgi:preprotein translocase subunit SecA